MTKSTGTRAAFAATRVIQKRSRNAACQTEVPLFDEDVVVALRTFISLRFAGGLIPATDVAELSHYLFKLGLPFGDLAVDPETASFTHNSSRKVCEGLAINDIKADMCFIQVPACDKAFRRTSMSIAVELVHEVLAQEFLKSPENILVEVEDLLTENWVRHSVRQEAESRGEICIPYGIFIDKTGWKGKGIGQQDSVLAVYVNILGEQQRRTVDF